MIFITSTKGNFRSPLLFIAVFCVLLVACHTSPKDKLDLLYGTTYMLVEKEKDVEKTMIHIEDFKVIKNHLNIPDIALYKIISHPKYRTYIAIDVNQISHQKSAPSFKEFDFDSLKGVFYKHPTPTNKDFYVIIMPYDIKEKLDSKFTQQYIQERFTNE